jgi:hypothetical protein
MDEPDLHCISTENIGPLLKCGTRCGRSRYVSPSTNGQRTRTRALTTFDRSLTYARAAADVAQKRQEVAYGSTTSFEVSYIFVSLMKTDFVVGQ